MAKDEESSPSTTKDATTTITTDFNADDPKTHAAVQEMLDLYRYISTSQSYTGFDTPFMTSVRLISASASGIVIWELDITPSYSNINNVMHGGAAGLIFDMATTACLCSVQREGYWDFLGGVTRSLNVSYLKSVPVGGKVRVVCELVQHGRTMAMLRGRMESLDGGTVYAVCEHHKVNVATLGGHLRLREEMRRGMMEERREGKL